MSLSKFEQFLQHRQNLIYIYKKGDMTKEEFIEENYNFITSLDIEPFKRIDNVKKAIYNYQYYNVLAKHYQMLIHEAGIIYESKREFIDLVNYYYYRKDKVTAQLLKLLDFRGIEAYYVTVKSHKLKNKLFEIVIKDPDILLDLNQFLYFEGDKDLPYIILHSKSESIANMLKKENVFLTGTKKSLVDSYINQRY